jgi:alpha-glucosidase
VTPQSGIVVPLSESRAMLQRILLYLTLLTTLCAAGEYTFLGDYVEHRQDGSTVVLTSTNRPLNLQFFEGGVIRVQIGETEPTCPLQLKTPRTQKVKVADKGSELVIDFDSGQVRLSKKPLRMTVLRPDGSIVTADDPAFGHGWNGNEVRCWKVLDQGHRFFGLGEKSGDVNKRGGFYTNWNSDIPAYRNDTDPLYCGIPFFSGSLENKAFGIFFANSYRSTFNLGAGNKRLYSFGAEDGGLTYYIFCGPTMKDVIAQYSDLTGRMSLPPKWALGYQQCRWSYYPEYEVRDVAKQFRQRKIPADVLYFDIHYMDEYKVFTWHPQRFPRPKALLDDLKQAGFKVVTIIDPGVKVEQGYAAYEEGIADNHFLKYLDGELYQGQVWPGWCHFPDFRKPATRAWWGSQNAVLRATGVDGFWNDMNEPALWGKEMPYVVEGIKSLHNVFALLMAQATYEGLLASVPNRRPFIVTRAGWAGIQRYAAVWTGDNSASYDDLALSIRTNLGLGLSGVPFVGCDVGGFIGRPDPELYVRWMQAASLSPFMRSHTVHDSPDQEPWSFGEETERRCRESIEFRYRLMPYLYSELYASQQTGVPMYRPVWLEFPEDEEAYNPAYQHQFLLGSHLLAAPVIRDGQRFQKVYLPKGRWVEVESGRAHEGGQAVLVEASLDTLPLFYREGAIIPSREVQQYVDESPLQELTVDIVPGKGHYQVVLDDGVTVIGDREFLEFHQATPGRLQVKIGSGPRSQELKKLRLLLHGSDKNTKVTVKGQSVSRVDNAYTVKAQSCVVTWNP